MWNVLLLVFAATAMIAGLLTVIQGPGPGSRYVAIALFAGAALYGVIREVFGLDFTPHQRRMRREVLPNRRCLSEERFIDLMLRRPIQPGAVKVVRNAVAQELEARDVGLLYPHDMLIDDLGRSQAFVSGLEYETIMMILERELGIALPWEEIESTTTVEDLIHLCERAPRRPQA